MNYPVAETFGSIQGEGAHCGTPMFFIRLAGCNVGKFEKPGEMDDLHLGNLRVFNSAHSICTTMDGQKLLCDTDYSQKFSFSSEELVAQAFQYKSICITGGEPFLHNLEPLINELIKADLDVNIETSGTKPIPEYAWGSWITCSPKKDFDPNFLLDDIVDEWKFLVGPQFNEQELRDFEKADMHLRPIYIQPIGDIHTHLKENITRCLDLLKRNPTWKLSAQLHKFLDLR